MSEPLAFVSVREVYPNIGNETLAFRAWIGALVAEQNDAMKILEGTKRWAAWWLDEGTAPAYIPTLSRFLRDRRYRIDPNPERPHSQKGGGARGAQKSWEPKPVSSKRFTAAEAHEPILSKPITVKPMGPVEPPKGFRPAAEILASRRST